ncbi:hypothetical protein ABZ835_32305 [Streptomyces sp. NPDC047461]|uniref:hypothetical protein n=1 Tax=Streptomyces sp. NPDC047461 TaxID=3155619 RepID=UPI0033D96BF1
MTVPDSKQPPPTSLLRIRLDALARDLDKVETVVTTAANATAQIKAIARWLDPDNRHGLDEPLTTLVVKSYSLRGPLRIPEFRDQCDRCDPTLRTWLGEELPACVEKVYDIVTQLRQEIGQIQEQVGVLDRSEDERLSSGITNGCSTLRGTIKTMSDELIAADGDPVVYQRLWDTFDNELSPDIQQLFTDYVDFVGGLAVRANTLDQRVCRLTDRLLKDLHLTLSVPSVVVPAQQTALGQVMQSVIKLGFPEWTIWGVPLVGHEVGLNVARTAIRGEGPAEFKVLLSDDVSYGMSQARRAAVFADVFAAYVLGPGYARAVIQSRLEPHRAPLGADDPPDAERAQVILGVLRHLGELKALRSDSEYRSTLAGLQEFWDRETRSLALVRADDPEVERFLEAALAALATATKFTALVSVWWDKAKELHDYLLTDQVRTPDWTLIMCLLTAAWEARARHPELTDDIERRAMELAMESPPPTSPYIPAITDRTTSSQLSKARLEP